MEQVSMNDGLDGRETVAFGLAAGEVAVFVLAISSAYAALRSGLPGAAGWCLAALLSGGGAALAWGRLAGRPLLEWAVLLARFVVRTRRDHVATLLRHGRRLDTAAQPAGGPVVRVVALRRHVAPPSRSAAYAGGPPRLAVVPGWRPARPPVTTTIVQPSRSRPHVVAFFSLNGGSGRTTLAVELATLLAVRGGAAAASGERGTRVALLDLTERSPSVALRLGIPLAGAPCEDAAASLVVHESGLLVLAASPAESTDAVPAAPWVRSALTVAERAGARVIVVDVDCDLGARCQEVLRRCDEEHVTVAPTAIGVLDAYRSTAVLRRLGLRDRIGYVANRWRDGADLSEAMADLGGSIAAAVPEDDVLVRAEARHRAASLDGAAAIAAALGPLAERIESATRQWWTAPASRTGSDAG